MSNTITQKSEVAVRLYLLTQLESFVDADAAVWVTEDRIYRGIENREDQANEGEESSLKEYPCITIKCADAEPILPYRGNWDVSAELIIESVTTDATGDTHDGRAGAAIDALLLYSDTCDRIIQACPSYYVGQINPGQQTQRVEDGKFITTQAFTLKSACSTALI